MPIRSFVVALLASFLSLVDARAAIVLPPPAGAELGTLHAASSAEAAGRRRAERVGFGREVPPAAAVIDGASLEWRVAPDGSPVARIEFVSPGAAALRLELKSRGSSVEAGLRFESADGPVPGTWTLADVANSTSFWSPVIEGERGTLVLEVPRGGDVGAVHLAVPRVSHLMTSPVRPSTSAGDPLRKRSTEVVCRIAEEPLLAEAAKSVVRLAFTDARGGDSHVCTGTLIANDSGFPHPLILTAAHCGLLESINVYWFDATDDCAGQRVPNYVQLTGGARVLAANALEDWAILRLRELAPPGARFAPWRAEPIPMQTTGWLLHHPAGDTMKATRGVVTGHVTGVSDDSMSGGGPMTRVAMEPNGVVGGSSGGGFFTRSPDGERLELRGALWGVDFPNASPAYFSRLDVALPLVRDLLTPNVGFPDGVVPVVEYWNRTGSEGQQFITADPRERAELDLNTRIRGWTLGGERFLAHSPGSNVPGSVPVCRFFNPSGVGAHFYSASEQECAAVSRHFGDRWILESAEAFRMFLPDLVTGECQPGMTPVFRFLKLATGAHEFTTDPNRVDWIRNAIQEGYGPGAPHLVAMCGPSR